MPFNSLDFAVFLPVVFVIYWFVVNKNLKYQNIFLLTASYFFYGLWDYRFLILIIFTSCVNYYIGLQFLKSAHYISHRLLLLLSVVISIGVLGFFKYYNFFCDNFIEVISFFGYKPSTYSLNIVLPLGISFYTFRTLTYTIDIYRKKLEPTNDFISFFTFVAFFPHLVAGPIERASNLLPQFKKKRVFKYEMATDGLRQILWGLFKKIVIADTCAVYVNDIFSNYLDYNGSTLMLGGVLFAFQIYGDFSGYSDIAIGTGRLFGFQSMRNFNFPYFSRDIAEFWRRWHISLSTWFRDYLYIPLGGSRGNLMKTVRNIFITFIVSGLWHGANWTFVIWGFLNACYFIPILMAKRNREKIEIGANNRYVPSKVEFLQILKTFCLTVIGWIFFRAENLSTAISYLHGIFNITFFSLPEVTPLALFILIACLLTVEWLQRNKNHALEFRNIGLPRFLRFIAYYSIVLLIFVNLGKEQEFIYFQF